MPGRLYEYIEAAEARALRKSAEKVGRPKLFAAMDLGAGKHAHWHSVLSGRDKKITVKAAERIRAGLEKAGAPVEKARAIVVRREPARPLDLRTPKAPTAILAPLRDDAKRVLEGRFEGRVIEFAGALGLDVTLETLTKFLRGGSLALDVAAEMSSKVAELAVPEPHDRTPHLTPSAGDLEPPVLRAQRLFAKFAPEAISIVVQLATMGGPAA